jgi:hypothetical protein
VSTTSFSAPIATATAAAAVVDAAVVATADTGHDRDPAVGQQPLEDAGVNVVDVPDQADVDLLAVDQTRPAARGHQPAVLAREPDRERPVRIDQPDDVSLHLPDQDHPDHVHRLGGGHPQPARERPLDAEPVQVGVDLRAAAVHHDDPDPGVPQEHDVFRERVAEHSVGHRVAAVLHDDGPAVEALQPRQRLDQRGRLVVRGHAVHVEYAEFSCT